MFITFEGPEGSGKSTQVPLLEKHLASKGFDVVAVREPGGTPIGDQVRDVLHDMKNQEMHPHTELLLYSASRAQIVAQVIRPHLERGGIVICDRYADSTMAYQGYGRGLALDSLRQITQFATGGLVPDLTVYLDLEPEVGLNRRNASGVEWNRMDSQTLDFYRRVCDGYQVLIAADPTRWVSIDARQSVEAISSAIINTVEARLRATSRL
ncbi:MAG TPA: dTMP kinase [Aggregatilineales bacterium]|nr:dTMP kinase [Aggregatilineales bacterium]